MAAALGGQTRQISTARNREDRTVGHGYDTRGDAADKEL